MNGALTAEHVCDGIRRHIRQIEIGDPIQLRGLTVCPLFGPESGPHLNTLSRALKSGEAEITEVSEAGSVPDLLAWNRGELPLLILDGEELLGAKQNRVVNTTLVIGIGERLRIPVSCIEAGRWHRTSRLFRSANRMVPSSLRRGIARRVSGSAASFRRFDADQSTVWREVEEYAGRRAVRSPTSSLSEAMDYDEDELLGYITSIDCCDGQVGLVAHVDGHLAGIDILGRRACYADAHRRLILSYAFAVMAGVPKSKGLIGNSLDTLRVAIGGSGTTQESPGLGKDVRFHSNQLCVAALWHGDGVVHLSAFTSD